ncbi:MAG: hypothetical protein AAF716_23680 [Cyanobacteria bacterium P01_D01_bin.1]
MQPIDVLPNISLQNRGKFSDIFLEQGITTFQAACHSVKVMPYGSNSTAEDSLILFEEGQGTCTTKHGAIAHLAAEQNLPIYKNLGFYRLDDSIVTGVNAILKPHGLSYIPQVHCFLGYETYRIDLTEGNCDGKNQTIDNYDFVVQVQPDPTAAEKKTCYLAYLRRYFEFSPELKAVGEDRVLELLEECDRQVKYQCSLMSSRLINAE